MSVLEIRHRSGLIETRELSKDAPLLVGQLPSSDIFIDAEGVSPLHCRISWNRKNFEVAAVGRDGVQVGGVTVRTAALKAGDVIRVGDVDIVLLAEPQTVEASPFLDKHRSHSPSPETPSPETPSPETPSPETPSPETPSLDTPNPETPETYHLASVSQAELRALSTDSMPVRSFHLSDQLDERPLAESPWQTGDNMPAGSGCRFPVLARHAAPTRLPSSPGRFASHPFSLSGASG